ncbi:CRISPR-associated RAMP protein [Planktothrix sp. FACHB-1355]|uniref:CRISPR-associated RAMP protein n=1 Tax=Aerosakkonema funiforme FACHB-1375 TaxID=2949571 RepID=A0A926ZJ12_9CYAN|nr:MULTISPECIES: CRISPR-associated RAMP protein Csx7 [Oscillatoriales]MBD2182391.1 CRISPR-associated RAMP protein [Aerosakkonema funiforme FACHB-1375]MBD3559255.1 CRISPR-associated RAMP protein [Planktothrix sp. FACHB-1355]
MFDTFKNRLEIGGTLTTITALRISAGRSTEPIGSDLPVIKDAVGRPLIPGSSFKGALRSRLESFLRGIVGSDRKLVANPAVEDEWSLKADEIKLLKETYTNDFDLSTAILEETDLVSRLFGSPWIASKFQVRDLTVLPDSWFGQYQERDGVAIDRDTETAADAKLYDFQVVPAGTQFEFKAVVENAEPWELGLLTIGLHQFETKQIPLGGGRSRGLGVVKLDIQEMQWFDAEDDPELLLTYLQNLVNGEMDIYSCYPERIALLKQEWTNALITHLRTFMSANTTAEENSNV